MTQRLSAPRLATLVLLLAPAWAAGSTVTVDFEEFALAPGTARNDFTANSPVGFSSQQTFFNNSYELVQFGGQTYVSWSGWAVSRVRDVSTPGFNPSTGALLNQFGAYNLPDGSGAGGSDHYAIAFISSGGPTFIDLPDNAALESIDLTNTTYNALSMLNGDPFAKKFGGASGSDPDYFTLTITGFAGLGATGSSLGSITFDLADYRTTADLLVSAWTTVGLASLTGSRSLGFTLASSDNTDFGGGAVFMNTPSYFAADNLRYRLPTAVPEPGSLLLMAIGGVVGALALVRHRAASVGRQL